MTVKAVIFDLDGTIATFNLDFKAMRAEVRGYLMKMGVPASVLKVNESIFEMLKKTEIFTKNQGKNAGALEEIRREVLGIAERYEMEAASLTSLLPGAVDTLKALREKGLKIGLCTINSEKTTGYILARFKLAEYFDATVPRNQVNHVKPSPEHCGLALKALGVAAEETAVVGDSVVDMQSAKELNMLAVGLPTGVSTREQLVSHGANFIITSITDLPVLIERMNRLQNDS